MATSYYNAVGNGLPCMGFPFKNTHTFSKRYLGGKALTGKVRAETTVITDKDTEMDALHTFWRVDCNYGLEPFIFSGPLFGMAVSTTDYLAQFVGSFEPTKDKDGIWTVTLNLKILSPIALVRDDAGEAIFDNNGEYLYTDLSLHTTTDNIIDYISLPNIVI